MKRMANAELRIYESRSEKGESAVRHSPFVIRRSHVAVIAVLLLSGCQSGKFTGDISHYTSPQVRGRVLAADTRQPLADVRIRRVTPSHPQAVGTPPKGAQMLMEPNGVQTDADGRFFLDGQRVIALFRGGGWHSVTLSFTHAGYREYLTNYTATSPAESAADGVPLVNAGEILLQPKSK